MQINNLHLQELLRAPARLPAELERALPALVDGGRVEFPPGGYELLRHTADVRVLPALLELYLRAPDGLSYLRRNWLQRLLNINNNNISKAHLRALIYDISQQNRAALDLDSPWCTQCYQPADRISEDLPAFAEPLAWVYCPTCLGNHYLREVHKVIAIVGLPPNPRANWLYIPLWDATNRTPQHVASPFDEVVVYPGLADQLDWALTAVVTALQNTSRGVPPIHLHTTESLTENTRRLIAPYLNERSA